MRPCTRHDFKRRGVKMTENFSNAVEQRICPDIPDDYDFYKVKNSYSDPTLRNSFSIEIVKCSE